jgi:glyoxylase-like metal-dependent hydrolase (beta-lactamase superfamily II)
LYLFIQAGHTPGVIGMLIKTAKSGAYIFTSDAVYSLLNYGPPIVLPGICSDPDSYQKNIARLHQLVDDNKAQLFVGHDVEVFNTWKKSPQWYE